MLFNSPVVAAAAAIAEAGYELEECVWGVGPGSRTLILQIGLHLRVPFQTNNCLLLFLLFADRKVCPASHPFFTMNLTKLNTRTVATDLAFGMRFFPMQNPVSRLTEHRPD